MSICKAQNLSKRFGPTYALRRVSFELPEGINLFLGPNGSGKSTCIKILAGLIKPSEGKVEVLGLNPWKKRKELMKQVSVVLEDMALPKRSTGLKVARYIASLRGLRWEEMLEFFNLFNVNEFVHRELITYSSGMYQRFVLAMAFASRPRILILDEPTRDLDAASKKVFFDMLEKHVKEGGSVILSTHILTDLPITASHVIFFRDGIILESESLTYLLERYGLYTIKCKVRNIEEVIKRLRSNHHVNQLTIENNWLIISTSDALSLISYLKSLGPEEVTDISLLPPDYLQVYRAIERKRKE